MSPGSRNRPHSREETRLSARKDALRLRARIIQAIRDFFIARDFLEVETPLLIPAPLPEAHIEAIPVADRYLHTSPESCMKRLLAAGYARIFQLGKCFRNRERGNLHLPEFTLLEWYEAGIDYEVLMTQCEALIRHVSRSLGIGEKTRYHGLEIDLRIPWDRISVEDAFDRHASLPLQDALKTGQYDEITVREIEPHLGINKPVFVYDYPASAAALARLKPGDTRFAERFELYVGGLELANGFSELTCPEEQRTRFEKEQKRRESLGKPVYPMPEKFLTALDAMPDAGGMALGVDRLVMILIDETDIGRVVSFTPEEV